MYTFDIIMRSFASLGFKGSAGCQFLTRKLMFNLAAFLVCLVVNPIGI